MRNMIHYLMLACALCLAACKGGTPSTVGPEEDPGSPAVNPDEQNNPERALPDSIPNLEKRHFFIRLDEARPCPRSIGTFIVNFNRTYEIVGPVSDPVSKVYQWPWHDWTDYIEVRAHRQPHRSGNPWRDSARIYQDQADIPQENLDDYVERDRTHLKLPVIGHPSPAGRTIYGHWSYLFEARAVSKAPSTIKNSDWVFIGNIDPVPTQWYKPMLTNAELVDSLTVRLTFEETAGCFQQHSYFVSTWFYDIHDEWLRGPRFHILSYRYGRTPLWEQPNLHKENHPGRRNWAVSMRGEEWEIPRDFGPPEYRRRYSFEIGRAGSERFGDPFSMRHAQYRFQWVTGLHWGASEYRVSHEPRWDYLVQEQNQSGSYTYVMDLRDGGFEWYRSDDRSLYPGE